ncbi:MAG: hypothetical protein H6907_09110 [Hyphomicrobiales bacterium]|nr:hypothetical protein [Hyphomicrobiales bacterium]MCP5371877.1 hypothetical protein [Hyphomicrobiales bacterium]
MPINADYWQTRRSLLRVASCGAPADVTGLAERAVVDLEALLRPAGVLKPEVAERRGAVTADLVASEAEELTRAIGTLSPECGQVADRCLRGYRDKLAKGYSQVACAAAMIVEVVEGAIPFLAI